MRICEILKPFRNNLLDFLETFGKETSDDDCFYVMIGNDYIHVDIRESYWYYEDDGTVVFRVNDY